MKFEENLFNISSKAYKLEDKSDTCEDKNVLKLQNELLKELFKKFEEELKPERQPWSTANGILKVYFVDHWRCACEKGFYLISDLVESGNFDSFAREYCIYLGQVQERTQQFTNQFYEVIWDYKTYFEQMGMHPDANKNLNQHEMSILASASAIPKLMEVDRTNDLAIASRLFSKEKAMTLGRKKNNKH